MDELKQAIEKSDVELFQHCLERVVQEHGEKEGKQALANSSALCCAARAGSIVMMRALVEKGAGTQVS